MIPASSMWPRVGNRFFTWADEANLELIVTRWFALEQSRVNDVSKRSSKELRVVENWHCVLARAQERRTSKAARYIIRLDWFWKSFKTFTFFPLIWSLCTSSSTGQIPECWSSSGIVWAQRSGSEQLFVASGAPWVFCQCLSFVNIKSTFILRPHLSSWPCIQVEIKRQHESGQGMILYWPHHLVLVSILSICKTCHLGTL